MHPVPRLSLIEQTALHLQQGIESGRWLGKLPGVVRLAGELGISKDTTEAALRLLESRGSVISHGPGRRREVAAGPQSPPLQRSLRVGMLLREELGQSVSLTQEIFLKLIHDLEALGHSPLLAPKSQAELGHDPRRIARMVETFNADAWIISGSSHEVTKRLSLQEKPFILLGGRHGDLPVASASMSPHKAIHESVRRLIEIGHKRIVMVCLPDWVRPQPGHTVQAFFQQLTAAGLPAGDYNAPYHETTPEGLAAMLESLFRLTPPTAMIVPNMHYAIAVMGFLGSRGLSVPRDVSLIVRSPDPAFDWVRPRIAHFQCPTHLLIRHIVHWVDACSKGNPTHRSKVVEARLVEGETITPPRSQRPD